MSCFFRTSFRGEPSLVNYDAVISHAHSNRSHELIVSGWATDSRRPAGQVIKVGQEQEKHQFTLDAVDFSELRNLSDSIDDVLVPTKRYGSYCVKRMREIGEEQKKKEELRRQGRRLGRRRRRKKKKKSDDDSEKVSCDQIRDQAAKQKCRMEKQEKCQASRRDRGKTPEQQPCTSSERKMRKAWPWTVGMDGGSKAGGRGGGDCDKMTLRSDRKVCKRLKRKICKKELKRKHEELREGRIVAICKVEQRIQSCAAELARKRRRGRKRRKNASQVGKASCVRKEERKLERDHSKRMGKGRKRNLNKMQPEDMKLVVIN